MVGDNQVLGRMKQTFAAAALAQPVVPWIFLKNRRIREVLKELGSDIVREVCSKTSGVAFGTLPKCGIPVRRLVDSSVEGSVEEVHWVNGILNKQAELVVEFQRTEHRAFLIMRFVHGLSFQGVRKYSYGLS